ncbi:rod shape-determining protein RodA [Candidatus Berkelbacteria bacterium]|nr:rod shape-determining protein RodA [Candidatus Berkelbacteria bacterium]
MRKFFEQPIDWVILIITILLITVGAVTIYTITFANNGTSLALSQAMFGIFGLILLIVFMFTDYRQLGNYSWIIFILTLALLVPLLPFWASKIPFVLKVFGAHRWLDFGVIQFQPAEILKLTAAIFAAKFIASKEGNVKPITLIVYLLITIVSFGLIVLQPDLGTASVVLVVMSSIFLASRPSYKLLLSLTIIVLILLPTLYSNLKPYQVRRVQTFLNPGSDPQGAGYNVSQAIIAVGSGGLMGKGFGQGSQTVLNFLPVPHADFIFAGYAEATGFIGSSFLVLLYFVLVYRSVNIARDSTDLFGKYLAIGIASKFAFQSFVHIGMNIGIMPVTGIPLPFMSYGGTALVIDMASIGILQSINIRHHMAKYKS